MDLQYKIDWYVAKYIEFRDKIKELNDAHKERMAPLEEAKDKLAGILLEKLNADNVESSRTEHGTFFRTTKKSASLEDADAFMRFVIGGEHWDLLDRKANVTAVEEFLKEHKGLPPGVKYTEYQDVNVRRPTKQGASPNE